MRTRLIIDGNAVYEIDEDCAESQKQKGRFQNRMKKQGTEDCTGRNRGTAGKTEVKNRNKE